jgi:uncharacterized membrane protein YfcA
MKILIIAAVILILSLVVVYISISAHNKDAKEKGTTEKGYTFWSALAGFLVTVFAICYELLYQIFIGRRRRIK